MHSVRMPVVCLLLVAVAICNVQSAVPEPSPLNTTTVEPVTTTAVPTTSTTTTTVKPETTTTKPTTTTQSSTSTMAPTTTTTTTTMAPSTTTVAPSPKPMPEPDMGTWSFTNTTTNRTCVIAQMSMQFNMSYFDVDGKPVNVLYNLPKEATVKSGMCLNTSDYIELTWPMDKQNNYSSLRLDFALNATGHEFAFVGLLVNMNVVGDAFPNAKPLQKLVLANNQTLFKTPQDMSYHCNKAQMLNMTSNTAGLGMPTVTVAKLQLEAFHTKQNNKFSIAKDCEAIDTPDIVPIAVGCALVTLIIIMLVAYLVGRNSAHSQGYYSM